MQIHIYAQQGNIAGVGHEIAKGVDIDCIDENEYSQQTPLMYAVSSTNAGIDMIHFLLEHGANVNAIAEQSDYTVLGLVVQSGNLEKIQLILDAGANIHYQTPQEYDVLIDAMHGRDILLDQNLLSILDLLISKGAAVNGMSSYGETAIKVAARIG